MGSCCACHRSTEGSDPRQDVGPRDWLRLGIAAAVAGQSMIFGLAINMTPPTGTARLVLHGFLALSAAVVFVLAGGRIARASWEALRARRIVFDQLFLLGIVAAFAASLHCTLTGVGHVYYEVVAVLVAIYTFGTLLTDAKRREALELAGDWGRDFAECEVERGGVLERVAVGDVREGEMVRVAAGEPVTVDGVVVEGRSFVEESTFTGEPFPVVKRPGDPVWAGTRALDGRLRVRVSAAGGARKLDKLLEALHAARLRPSRLQRQADLLASWFLPAVVAIAAATFAGWTWAAGWERGLFNALAVIIVACPCAMGIATPVAIWSALGELARGGVVVHDSDILEKLAQVDVALFDKTGTLGGDSMDIVDFVTAPDADRAALRARAAGLQATSGHPIARAFAKWAADSAPSPERVETLPGRGIAGRFGDGELVIGNKEAVEPGRRAQAEALEAEARKAGAPQGTHVVYLLWNGRPAGLAVLRETLRDSARQVLEDLKTLGVEMEILTGDRPEAAAQHGLPNVRAGLSPQDKAARVREWQAQGRHVLFVGDGINDAPALSAADAALAIQSGAGLARASAGAEIAGANLRAVSRALALARSTVRAIRGNLLFAACYNAVGVGLAAAGLLHPVVAALIMLLSSFTVTGRSLQMAAKAAWSRHFPEAEVGPWGAAAPAGAR